MESTLLKKKPVESQSRTVYLIAIAIGIGLFGIIIFIVAIGIISSAVTAPAPPLETPYPDNPATHCGENGEFWLFGEVQCLCYDGLDGESKCQEPITNDTFLEPVYFDWTSWPFANMGIYTWSGCNELCENDTDCVGTGFFPVDEPRRTDYEEYGDTFGECDLFFDEFLGYELEITWFKTTFELMPIPEPEEPEEPRRSELDPLVEQQYLRVKTGTKCHGYLCHYNEHAGLVWVDYVTYQETNAILNEYFDGEWDVDEEWYDWFGVLMGNHTKYGQELGDVLEINEMPLLLVSRLLDAGYNTTSIKIASSRAVEYLSQGLDAEYSEVGYILDDRDYSLTYMLEEELYDTIILTFPSYGRFSLPRLFYNVYRLLKPGGTLFMYDHKWTYIDVTGIANSCMAAGMPTENFTEEFLAWFTELGSGEDSEIEEPPTSESSTIEPLGIKREECWFAELPSESPWLYYMPGHTYKWFMYAGTK